MTNMTDSNGIRHEDIDVAAVVKGICTSFAPRHKWVYDPCDGVTFCATCGAIIEGQPDVQGCGYIHKAVV